MRNKELPLISIVTVTYNAEKTLERTLCSVEEQTYGQIEHLIIDGCSEDHTMGLVQRYIERNTRLEHNIKVLREPDNGLYDAMNKAITMAEGDYIVFLNAGDKLHAPDTIQQIVSLLDWDCDGVNPAVVYGETDLVDDHGTFMRHRRLRAPEKLDARSFQSGMLVCHQSFYARTDLAKEIRYNLDYRFSADYDWCIRILQRAQRRRLRNLNTHLVLTDYLNEGLTTKNHRKSLVERMHLMAHHYGWPTTVFQHLWFIIRSVIRR